MGWEVNKKEAGCWWTALRCVEVEQRSTKVNDGEVERGWEVCDSKWR